MRKLTITSFFIFLFALTSCNILDNFQMDLDFLSYEKDLEFAIAPYNDHLQELNIGFSTLVIKDNTKVNASIGNENFTDTTLFNIGSATKKMTSILILQEVEKGNILLNDSIGSYLSPIKNVDGSLTIETLLRHKSGLGELIGSNVESLFFDNNDDTYNTGFLQTIPAPNPEMVGKYEYCNTNYFLLGHLLEKVTDKTYADLLRERIFIPSEMVQSSPYLSKHIPNLAHPIYNGIDVINDVDSRFYNKLVFSAGSVASSLSDMAKFYQELFIEKSLISESSLALLTEFDDNDYGLGMMQLEHEGHSLIGHGGNNIGYAFREYYNPTNGDLVLYFSNTMQTPYSKIIDKTILNFMLDVDTSSDANTDIASIFGPYVGTYFFKEMNLEVKLYERSGNFYVNLQGNDLLLFNHRKNALLTSYHGIELEIAENQEDSILFQQAGMQATLSKVK